MRAMTRRALARSATISAGAAIAVPPKTPLARSCMATLQHTRLGAVAYGRICPVHVWPVLRCPPRLLETGINPEVFEALGDELDRPFEFAGWKQFDVWVKESGIFTLERERLT